MTPAEYREWADFTRWEAARERVRRRDHRVLAAFADLLDSLAERASAGAPIHELEDEWRRWLADHRPMLGHYRRGEP